MVQQQIMARWQRALSVTTGTWPAPVGVRGTPLLAPCCRSSLDMLNFRNNNVEADPTLTMRPQYALTRLVGCFLTCCVMIGLVKLSLGSSRGGRRTTVVEIRRSMLTRTRCALGLRARHRSTHHLQIRNHISAPTWPLTLQEAWAAAMSIETVLLRRTILWQKVCEMWQKLCEMWQHQVAPQTIRLLTRWQGKLYCLCVVVSL